MSGVVASAAAINRLPTPERPAKRGEGSDPARPDPSTGPPGPTPNQRLMPVKEVNSI